LFFGDFKEKNQEEIEIKDVKYKHFARVLKMLYVDDPVVTDSNVESILTVADRFGVQPAKDKAQLFLLTSSYLSKHTKLRFADQYNVPFLKEAMLRQYKSLADIQGLKEVQ
ncbi:hypothetical protein PFISCL1PPCAC_12264, partial [Pristionchus fissidentatus]